ncbi:CbtA family protein [uncultured Phyllobacterium sp.]|uniref:CbtA family protein n=1 Tax=uncultured Phyllobacterium sp. TaxID=253813 RepID=UPI0025841E8B|nr:CbtA family protein [uncultured Phyllobacterium sp.]
MTRDLLIRGMIVGVIAGLLAFGFARVFGEPQVDHAIAFEEKMSQAAGAAAEPELVTRATQAGIGLFTGIVVYSAALGGLFSLVFAFVHGRVSSLSPRSTAALLALAGFVAIVLVPCIKYPMNPPAVGSPDTIGARTELFFVMLVVSLGALAAAVGLAKRLYAQHGAWNATLMAGAAYVVFIALVQYSLPAINEVPEQFSPTVLWNFRVASLGIHVIVWTTLGLLFGALAERVLAGQRPRYRLHAAR